ncbi:MAG: WS/DGAT/MGAT family O-acyltransferase [Solirubrobacterales bacterium]
MDAAWLVLESRDTPMHVGGLFEFTLPPGASRDFLHEAFEEMREVRTVPPPWNLRPVELPVPGSVPLLREDRDVDIDYHFRHSALPQPGGQRELGILVSRLHSNQLDLHRPLWEMHLIEGLEGDRFAIYLKMHHSLIDGVSGMRLMLRTLSSDPDKRGTPPFWAVGARSRSPREDRADATGDERPEGRSLLRSALSVAGASADVATGLGKTALELSRARLDGGPLQAPYGGPRSVLSAHLSGQRRFATQQYELTRVKALAKAAGCTLNDIVLYLCSTALRRYLQEHGRLPDRSLTAGIPVNVRAEDDQSMGTAISFIIAELGTDIPDPRERLEAIKSSTSEAKRVLRELPSEAVTTYTLAVNGLYIAGLALGLGGRTPTPFSLGMSNVPGPTEPLYFNGARLDALFPLSLLLHGNALNITCVSYAGTLNFGLTGARDTLPHLQRLAIYMGEALDRLDELVAPESARAAS